MKTFKVYDDGRMPLWQSDFKWLQDSYKEMIVGLAKALGIEQQYYIITGCDVKVEGTRINVSDGLVYWNGDIIRVEGAELSSASSDPKIMLTKQTRYDLRGNKTFITLDGVNEVKQTYEEDVLVPSIPNGNIGMTGGFWFQKNAWKLVDRIRSSIFDEGAWQPTDVVAQQIYYKRVGSLVYLRGVIKQDAVGSSIPSGVYGKVPVPSDGIPQRLTDDITINANGDVMVQTNKSQIIFDSKSYVADSKYVNNNSRQGYDHGQAMD